MSRRLSPVATLGAMLALVLVLAGAHASAARADFTETFCDGSPAAPWTDGGGGGAAWGETTDGCADGGAYGWDNATTSLPAGGTWGAQIVAPPGEVFTGESPRFSTEPRSSGSETFVVLGYDSTILAEWLTDDGATHLYSSALPDASSVWARYDCSTSASTNCILAAFPDVLAVGPMSLTVHDTGRPTVAAAGGSLATDATVKGAQTLLFDASDTGSGVAQATVSLGSTVVGSDAITCQTASLTPCPASTAGTIVANTALVPDGSYPVILTAYDASGDPNPVQVATVTVDNHSGTTTVRSTTHRRRAIHTRVTFKWDPRAKGTRLIWTRVGRLPRHARITATCHGHRCPFHAIRGTARRVGRFERRMRHRTFHTGQRLTITITAPHRTAERGTMRIRHDHLPVLVRRRRHRHR